jgi:hypothetical protein
LLVGLDSKSKNNGSNWPVLWKLASPVLSTASILWLSNLKMFCYYWNHSFSNALNATCKLISLIVGWTDKTLQTSRRQRLILRKDAKFLPQIHNVTMCFNAQPKKKSVKDMHQMYQNVEKKSKNKLANATIGT